MASVACGALVRPNSPGLLLRRKGITIDFNVCMLPVQDICTHSCSELTLPYTVGVRLRVKGEVGFPNSILWGRGSSQAGPALFWISCELLSKISQHHLRASFLSFFAKRSFSIYRLARRIYCSQCTQKLKALHGHRSPARNTDQAVAVTSRCAKETRLRHRVSRIF